MYLASKLIDQYIPVDGHQESEIYQVFVIILIKLNFPKYTESL